MEFYTITLGLIRVSAVGAPLGVSNTYCTSYIAYIAHTAYTVYTPNANR
jgi:hypothetical protein